MPSRPLVQAPSQSQQQPQRQPPPLQQQQQQQQQQQRQQLGQQHQSQRLQHSQLPRWAEVPQQGLAPRLPEAQPHLPTLQQTPVPPQHHETHLPRYQLPTAGKPQRDARLTNRSQPAMHAKHQRQPRAAADTLRPTPAPAPSAVDRATSGGSGTSAGSGGTQGTPNDGADEDTEWFRKRRQNVARASKNAREKKKREIEVLRTENKRLRHERAEFLNKIEMLQAVLQANREGGQVDLQLENELLKAQLEEHTNFVSAINHIARGIPTNDRTKMRVYKQGADFATQNVLSLLTRPVTERQSWTRGRLPPSFQDLPFSDNLRTISFRIVEEQETAGKPPSRRLLLRLDHQLPGYDLGTTSDLYWRLWHEPDMYSKYYDDMDPQFSAADHQTKEIIREDIEDDSLTSKGKQRIIISYVREASTNAASRGRSTPEKLSPASVSADSALSEGSTPHDWIFVSSRTQQDISKATLYLPRFNLDRESCTEDLGDCAECIVCARTSTKNLVEVVDRTALDGCESTPIETSHYVEGAALWALDSQPGCFMVTVMSMPEIFEQRWLNGFGDVICPDGTLTIKFASYIEGFHKLVQKAIASQQSQHLAPPEHEA